MYPCKSPCEDRLWWDDPASVFRRQAYYFEFDVNRHLIRKTHYEHLDEAFLRWEELSKEGIERTRETGLDWSSMDGERFRAAKVVALDVLAAQTALGAYRDRYKARLGESPATVPQSGHCHRRLRVVDF